MPESRKDRTAILGGIPPIFRLKWYPILVISQTWYHICRFPPHMFTDSTYFLPIFHLKWYPILVINSSMEPHLQFFCLHVYRFRLFSAYFLPNLPLILSCRVLKSSEILHLTGTGTSESYSRNEVGQLCKI